MRFLFILCTLKLDVASSNQIQLVPTNQGDWCKALTALLEIPTTSQLFIDTDEMHHMPMMESSIVLVKITLFIKLMFGVILSCYWAAKMISRTGYSHNYCNSFVLCTTMPKTKFTMAEYPMRMTWPWPCYILPPFELTSSWCLKPPLTNKIKLTITQMHIHFTQLYIAGNIYFWPMLLGSVKRVGTNTPISSSEPFFN